MKSLMVLLVSSVMIQYLVERIKDFLPDGVSEKLFKYVKPSVFALIFAIAIAFGCQVDIFSLIGFDVQPAWLAYILTAITLSGGSVAVNELIKSLASIKVSNQNSAQLFDEANTYNVVATLDETKSSETDD